MLLDNEEYISIKAILIIGQCSRNRRLRARIVGKELPDLPQHGNHILTMGGLSSVEASYLEAAYS